MEEGSKEEKALRWLSLCNQYIGLSTELEGVLQSGRFHLATSRLQVGYGFGSVAQMDERERSATLRVEVKDDDTFHVQADKDTQKLPFGLLRPSDVKKSREDFVRAATIACELAGIKAELESFHKTPLK